MDDSAAYFSGECLIGDDYTPAQIEEWYAAEAEAYQTFGVAPSRETYTYPYSRTNWWRGFRHLPEGRWSHVMSYGGCYGHELLPIIERIDRVTVLESSEAFIGTEIGGVPAQWVKPLPSGRMGFPDDTFDLITAFGVLHHIPNVSFCVRHLARVLAPGGCLLIREPIVSMGDWRKPRKGITARERGIPLTYFMRMFAKSGLEVERWSFCDFPLVHKLFKRWDPYNTDRAVLADTILCAMFRWNYRYHPATAIQRLRARSAFFVLRKP